ncbi:hypothetical protein CNR22_01690 [Sphingobacteriaceae bacterium]|nr:hypothetical protein CNR22_01690 [Sphingobacteriaceae bacterium]
MIPLKEFKTLRAMKNNRRLLISFFLVLIFCQNSMAQTPVKDSTLAGIYASYDDFTNGRLSYQIDCSMEKQKIRLHDFMQKPFVEVFYKGRKIKLFKDELFGYQDCKGNMFRFYCNQEFQLAEIRDLSIYFLEENVSNGTSFNSERIFYFAVRPDGPLLPLTLQNIRSTFSGNQKFLQLVNCNIQTERDLSVYDDTRKTFMVNHLYALSQQP